MPDKPISPEEQTNNPELAPGEPFTQLPAGEAQRLENVASTEITHLMEVHHHPDLHHKKQKFKEYF